MVSARLWDLWTRADTGPICPEKDWVLKRYWPRVNELVKEYGIEYNPNMIVPTDDSLLDDIYEAGMTLLLDVGFFCTDTSRIIEFEESEVKEALRDSLSEGVLGEGKDAIQLRHLNIEDDKPPFVLGGPCGTPVSEEIAVKVYQSYAKEPIVDIIYMAALESVEGVTIKAGSPLELHAELYNIALARTATRKAGKPGMPIYGSCFPSLATDMNATSPEYGYKRTDLRCLWTLPHMKVDYQSLSRAAHFAEYGCNTCSCGQTFLGGLSGGPETSVVTTVAESLGTIILYQTLINMAAVLSTRYEPYVNMTDRMALWGSLLATSAVNKNTSTITYLGTYTYAGPCTEMCFLELAAEGVAGMAMGLHPYGTGPNGGLVLDHCTGMESRFHGEVARAAIGIKRKDANDIVKTLIAKYQPFLDEKKIPYGKSFQECYNLKTITPTPEYQALYDNIRKELENMGLDFDQ